MQVNNDLDALFLALAHPTRRAILERLRGGEATVAELGDPFHMSQPAITRHLKVLEDGAPRRVRECQKQRI
ncbi:MAG TPA: metalloregulator ArsR/SmtB family transcription factor, partial [Mycobacterium sp.]|nr:metalloregulator ArsR/SmtB family transcription factor [Mycobacterium sp.]